MSWLIVKLCMTTNVLIVRNRLLLMAMTTESIVAEIVLMQPERVVRYMNKEQFNREKMYLATMNLAKNLLNQGVITEEQYAQIDTIFTKKYAPSLSTLFTKINLI